MLTIRVFFHIIVRKKQKDDTTRDRAYQIGGHANHQVRQVLNLYKKLEAIGFGLFYFQKPMKVNQNNVYSIDKSNVKRYNSYIRITRHGYAFKRAYINKNKYA